MLYTTSSAVISAPSWNLAPRRSLNVYVRPSGDDRVALREPRLEHRRIVEPAVEPVVQVEPHRHPADVERGVRIQRVVGALVGEDEPRLGRRRRDDDAGGRGAPPPRGPPRCVRAVCVCRSCRFSFRGWSAVHVALGPFTGHCAGGRWRPRRSARSGTPTRRATSCRPTISSETRRPATGPIAKPWPLNPVASTKPRGAAPRRARAADRAWRRCSRPSSARCRGCRSGRAGGARARRGSAAPCRGSATGSMPRSQTSGWRRAGDPGSAARRLRPSGRPTWKRNIALFFQKLGRKKRSWRRESSVTS